MFDYIQSSISTLSDRREVLRSLTISDEPWMRLLMQCDATTVALWIADGKRIAHAKCIPHGPDGNLAMLAFMRSNTGKFQLERIQNGAGGGRDLDISLSKLLDDEAATLGFIDACAHSERLEGDPEETQDNLPAVQPQVPPVKPQVAPSATTDGFDSPVVEAVASPDLSVKPAVEQSVNADAAKPEPSKAPQTGIFATAEVKRNSPTLEETPASTEESDDGARIRQELEFANSLYSQSKESFYLETPELQQQSDADLQEKRQKEFEYLSQFYSADDKSFEHTDETLAEAEKSSSLSEGQKQLLDAVSVFTDPTAFAEADPEIAKGKQSEMEPLNDLQKRVLELSAAESDPAHFAEQNPVLSDNRSIRPIVAEPLEPLAVVDESLTAELDAIPDPADVNSHGNATTAAAGVGGPDIKAFLRRENKEGSHVPGAFIPERFRGKRLPTAVIVAGIAALVLLPPAILATNYLGQKSDDEAAQRKAAEELAERSMAEKSVTSKPKEAAFRLPAGSHNSTPPSGQTAGSNQRTSGSAEHFEFHAPKNPQSVTSEQIAAAAPDIQKADGLLAAGYGDRAVSIYVSLLQKYPTYTQLRIRAARAYMAIRDYQDANQILVRGLSVCQTQADFDMLMSVIREIP